MEITLNKIEFDEQIICRERRGEVGQRLTEKMTVMGPISTRENQLFHFIALVARQSATLTSATQHAMFQNCVVCRRVLTLASICLFCHMEDTT